MKVLKTLPAFAIAALLVGCSSSEELALLHDDDIYFNPDEEPAARRTVTQEAFGEEQTKTAEVEDFDYYDPDAAQETRRTYGNSQYYDMAYGSNFYDRFRFNVGIGYGWGGSYMGFGYGNFYPNPYDPFYMNYGYNNFGWSPGWGYGWSTGWGYGWSPYYGYGYGYGHCPSIYGGPWYGGGYAGTNGYYNGHRPTNGGTGTVGSSSVAGYRSPAIKTPQSNTPHVGTPRNTSGQGITEIAPAPMPNKQPIYYSPSRVENSQRTSRNESGFSRFMRDAGNSMSISPNSGGSNRVGNGRSSGSSRPSASPSSRPSSRPATTPSNSGRRR